VFVLLASFARDYLSATTSRLVEVDADSDSIVSTLPLDGMHDCEALAASANGRELAVGCTGGDTLSPVPSIDAAGLALIDISGAPRISQRFGALAFGTNPWASPSLICQRAWFCSARWAIWATRVDRARSIQ